MSGLQIIGLTKRFGGLIAVNDVSFDVPAQGVSAVIGPNGAGKTTLFSMISGALVPSAGQVVLDGRDITGLPSHAVAACGLVRTFQLVRLFNELTVRENVAVGCHLHTRGGLFAALATPPWARRQEREVGQRARELLALVGLAGAADAPASSLPYGQQRLLEVARAMAARPKLLLLDEPAAGLNTSETENLARIIRQIAATGTGVLLIEHDMSLVLSIADQIAVLEFGRKIAFGSPDQIRRDPAVLAAYLGTKEQVA
jgi:branched-chain amino acid transport system ATP-binding protein